MMELFDVLKQFNLNPVIIVMVIAGGFWAKTYFKWEHIHIGKFRMALTDAWKTLIVGTLFAALYVGITFVTEGLPKEIWMEIFYSYIFATSFYELIIQPVVKFIKKKLGSEDEVKP